MKPLIIYHNNCTDGFGAAYAAHCALKTTCAEYLPMNYTDPLRSNLEELGPLVKDRLVYILDFSLTKEATELIIKEAYFLVWLDHHKTAFETWVGEAGELYQEKSDKAYIRLDNNKSGALLAWEHFHPTTPAPLWTRLIDDRDRWQFQIPQTPSFHAGMTMQKPWTFEKWDALFSEGTMGLGQVLSVGDSVLAYQKQQVDTLVKYAKVVVIRVPNAQNQHYEGLAVNTSIHMSEVGHELANQSGSYGLIWYLGSDDTAKVSLRSNGDYDVSAIAKAFGGGGHKNAAGFSVPIITLLEWLK